MSASQGEHVLLSQSISTQSVVRIFTGRDALRKMRATIDCEKIFEKFSRLRVSSKAGGESPGLWGYMTTNYQQIVQRSYDFNII